jgi:hypothetical protein
MKMHKELLTIEFDRMLKAMGGIGTTVSLQRTHYEHSDRVGWLAFTHDKNGVCERFLNLEDLEERLNTNKREILFRKF